MKKLLLLLLTTLYSKIHGQDSLATGNFAPPAKVSVVQAPKS